MGLFAVLGSLFGLLAAILLWVAYLELAQWVNGLSGS